MKIIINAPDLKSMGGVSNHYRGLKTYLPEFFIFNTTGSRWGINGILLLPFDFIKTVIKLILYRPGLAILNPSLQPKALMRDDIFLLLYNIFKIKTVVFFHGWDKATENNISLNIKKISGFKKKSTAIIVLSSEFKNKLQDWGFKQPIFVETTKIADELIKDFDISKKNYIIPSLLFLSRIEKNKGIYTAIDLFIELKKNHPELTLKIVGEGTELENVKELILLKKINNIIITGRLDGEELKKVFFESNIYLFPSQHGEGLPTSVLEAMAFGCCLITSVPGGLADIIENSKHGFIIDPANLEDMQTKAEIMINNYELRNQIGYFNHNFAKSRFLASQVSQRFCKIIEATL